MDTLRRLQVAKREPRDRPALKGSRWALLKQPERLKDEEASRLSSIEQTNRALSRGYLLKESFLDILSAGSR